MNKKKSSGKKKLVNARSYLNKQGEHSGVGL
jgi:hypothetical protein